MALKNVLDLYRLMQAKLQGLKKSLSGFLSETFLYLNNAGVFVKIWQPSFILEKISGFFDLEQTMSANF